MSLIKTFLVVPILSESALVVNYEVWSDKEILKWIRPDTGEEHQQPNQFGPGAMWRATWYSKNMTWDNETEPHLIVLTPGGDWDIDSRCSNCGLPEDRLHRCWVRHGDPPNITVDKNGLTCNAGAGSIKAGSYHGMLINGELHGD